MDNQLPRLGEHCRYPAKVQMTKRRKLLLAGLVLCCLFGYLTLHDSFVLGKIKTDVVRIDIYDIEQYLKCRRPLIRGNQVIRDAMSHETALSKSTFQTIDTPNDVRHFLGNLNVTRFNLRLFLFNCRCKGQQAIVLTYSDGRTDTIGLAHNNTLKFDDAFGDLRLTPSSCEVAHDIAKNAERAFGAKE